MAKDRIKLEFNPMTQKWDLVSEFNTDRIVTHMYNSDGETPKGYDEPLRKTEKFSLNVSNTDYNNAYSVHIMDGETVKVNIDVVAQHADGIERACYIRSGIFYRQGSMIKVQGGLQSDFTMESNIAFNIDYIFEDNKAKFRVRNAFPVQTFWTGYVQVDYVLVNPERLEQLRDIDPMVVVDNEGNIVLAG